MSPHDVPVRSADGNGDSVVAVLVHSPSTRSTWIERAVLYETASRSTSIDDLGAYEAVIAHAARLGADGVLLGGLMPDARDSRTAKEAAPLVQRATRLGIRLIVSIADPADAELADTEPADAELADAELEARARAWLDVGAHGVDLGTLHPRHAPVRRARRLISALTQRYGAHVVVSAHAAAATESEVLGTFTGGPMPLLRHNRLWAAGWDAPALREMVTATCRWHDATRAPLTWSLFSGARSEAPRLSTIGVDAEGAARRLRAAILTMLALPGAVVLRQGEEVALPFTDADAQPGELAAEVAQAADAQRGDLSSSFENYRTALRLRGVLELGSGSLAWVQHPSLPSSRTLAFANRDLIALMVTGPEPVSAGSRSRLLHASADVETSEDGRLEVSPGTAVWLSSKD